MAHRGEKMMGNMCAKCGKMTGIIFLLIGIAYLITDLGIGGWNFWGIQWWTILFLLMGLGGIGCASCGECRKMRK